MSDNDNLSHDLTTALEARLRGWKPKAPALDHNRLMFEAGRAAARAEQSARLRLVAGSLSAMLLLACLGLGGLYARERSRALELAMALNGQTDQATPQAAPHPPVVPVAPDVQLVVGKPDPNSYLAISQRVERLETGRTRDTEPLTGPDGGGSAEGTWTPLQGREDNRFFEL